MISDSSNKPINLYPLEHKSHSLHKREEPPHISTNLNPNEAEIGRQIEESPLMDNPNFPLREPAMNSITLTFHNLSYSVLVKGESKSAICDFKCSRKDILRDLTGVCRPKELTAIMGVSGAGKTTLLNILSTRTTGVAKNILRGQVKSLALIELNLFNKFLANGHKYSMGKFSKFAGYVMQNDILFETMTPRGIHISSDFILMFFEEIFQFTADLRLSNSIEDKRRKINRLLRDLQLEKAADTPVGGNFRKGISGGERKRTSIGVELITNPNLLLLDEPTSGLDSFTAFLLINLLKNLAVRDGKTIIFTIHQPSSDIFFLFDNLMILAKGKFIYQGFAHKALDYFSNIGYPCPEYANPADYFIDIAHPDNNNEKCLEDMFQAYSTIIAPKIEQEASK